jgi:hypothetical protein
MADVVLEFAEGKFVFFLDKVRFGELLEVK